MALAPARTKYRKSMKGSRAGNAKRGNTLAFGEFGLQSLSRGPMTGQQIEAARAQIELALEVVVVELAAGQRGVSPPAVLLELSKRRSQITVEFVVRIVMTGLQILPVETARHTDAPRFIQAVAAADVEVVTAAVGAGAAALAVDIQMLAAGGNNRAPLADRLPVLPVRLPLVTQFILMRAHRAVGHIR